MSADLADTLGSAGLVAFLEANGLDADAIPARGSVRIVSGFIDFRTYDLDADGLLQERTDGGRGPRLTGWRQVPMTVAPEAVAK